MSFDVFNILDKTKVNENRTKLIEYWFYNLTHEIINNEILLVTTSNYRIIKIIKNYLIELINLKEKNADKELFKEENLINNLNHSFILVDNINYLLDFQNHYKGKKNFILLLTDKFTINELGILNQPLLIFDDKYIFSNITANKIDSIIEELMIKLKEDIEKPNILPEHRLFYYIGIFEPINIILDSNKKLAKIVILYIFYFYKELMPNFDNHRFIKTVIKNTLFESYESKEYLEELIERDSILFEEHSLLTSRFAIILYKITKLDLFKKNTEIGNYYSDRLNIQSTNFYKEYGQFSKDFRNRKDLFAKLFKSSKGYYLDPLIARLSSRDATKVIIARKLLLDKKLDLTQKEIREITDLSPKLMMLLVKSLGTSNTK